MDQKTFREMIVQSAAAQRMIRTVSPIYDDSYVGCWLFEDIGREWDRLWDIIIAMPDQAFSETVTWAIQFWEQKYGITPEPGDTLEMRRARIIDYEQYPKPFTPYALDAWCQRFIGAKATVNEHVAPYTFAVEVESTGTDWTPDLRKLIDYINNHKQSHLSYTLANTHSDRGMAYFGAAALYNTEVTLSSDCTDIDEDWLIDEMDTSLADENGVLLFV